MRQTLTHNTTPVKCVSCIKSKANISYCTSNRQIVTKTNLLYRNIKDKLDAKYYFRITVTSIRPWMNWLNSCSSYWAILA